MKTTTSIRSEELSKEDLRALLQAIRDCEMATFPEKVISIAVEAPAMTSEDMVELVRSIKPPYDIGPVILNIRSKER